MREITSLARRAESSATLEAVSALAAAAAAAWEADSDLAAEISARLAASSALRVALSIVAMSGPQDASMSSASAAAWRRSMRAIIAGRVNNLSSPPPAKSST